jgi:hypothetical protein
MFAIKGDGCVRSGILGDITTQHHMVRKDHGTETQHVGANGSHQNTRNRRMHHGSSRCHAVRSGTSWPFWNGEKYLETNNESRVSTCIQQAQTLGF